MYNLHPASTAARLVNIADPPENRPVTTMCNAAELPCYNVAVTVRFKSRNSTSASRSDGHLNSALFGVDASGRLRLPLGPTPNIIHHPISSTRSDANPRVRSGCTRSRQGGVKLALRQMTIDAE